MKVKIYLLMLICSLAIFLLTGCYYVQGVEAKAYAIALGIDVSDTHNLKLTVQFAVLNSSKSSTSSEDSSISNSTILSVDCSTLDSGITLINSYISKQVNLSHCKAVIISEEFSSHGVSDIVYTLMNSMELRPDCNIIISKCNALDFLENSSPVFESNPAQYFTLNFNSSEYTGYVDNLTLSEFYYNIIIIYSDASAILAGINNKETQDKINIGSSILDDNYIAGKTPIVSKNNVESMGIAVFRNDKLVGELNNLETLCHLIITNNLKNATINITNPFANNSSVSFYVNLNKLTKKNVSFVNNYPYIECEIWITGNIPTTYSNINLSDEDCLTTLNSALNDYIEAHILEYLYKTSKILKADIAGFGKYVLPKYATSQEFVNSDWIR